MVDPISYAFWGGQEERATLTSGLDQPTGPLRSCTCKNCEEAIYRHAVKPRFDAYTKVNPLVTESLTDHQYFLCDQEVEAFVFKFRAWGKSTTTFVKILQMMVDG